MGDEGKAGAELSDQAIAWLVSLDCGSADERAFAAWRDADPRHAAAFAQVAAMWRRTADPRLSVLLDRPDDAKPQPEPEAEVEAEHVAPRTWSRRAVAGSAMAALLAVGGGFLAWPRRAYAATAVGERRTLRLPDGSHAMLNTDTRVSWRFEGERDFWIERGEAALAVGPGDKPFRVHSAPIDAHLSGGRFDIRIEPKGGELLVMTGQAAASYRGKFTETIDAGNALKVDDGTRRIAPVSPDAIGTATAWQSGKIVFNGMPLDQAVAEFNRYLPEKIVLQNADLAATPLGGEFQIDDPDAFLLALRDGFDIDHRRESDRIVLFRGR